MTQRSTWVITCLAMVLFAMSALPSYAQFPETAEEQIRMMEERRKAAQERLKAQQEKTKKAAPNASVPPTPSRAQRPEASVASEPDAAKNIAPTQGKRKVRDTRGVDNRGAMGDARPKKDPREVAPAKHYKALRSGDADQDVAADAAGEVPTADALTASKAVCDNSVATTCSEQLSSANRSCSAVAERCKKTPSSSADQSCAMMHCDVGKAECMKVALDAYITCVNAELTGGA